MCAYYQCAAAAIRQGSCATDPSYSTLYLNVAVQETSCLQLAANLRCSWSDYDLAIACTANLTCRSRALNTCTAACYAQSIQCYKQAGCSGQKDDYTFCAALLKEEALTCDACTLLPTSPGVTLTPVPADTNANSPCINHYRRCNDAVKYNGNAPPQESTGSGSNSTVIIVAISVSLGIVALFTVAVLVFVAMRRKSASHISVEPTGSTSSRRNSRGPPELSEQRERAPKEARERKGTANGAAVVAVSLSSEEEDNNGSKGKQKKKKNSAQGSTTIPGGSSPTTVFTVSSTLTNTPQGHLHPGGSQSEGQGARIRRSPSGSSRPAWTPETGGVSRSPGNATVSPAPQPIPTLRNSDKYRQDAYATHTDFELDDSQPGRGSTQPPSQLQANLLSDRQQRTGLLEGSTDANGNSVRTFSVSQSSAENGLDGRAGYSVPLSLSTTAGPLPAPTTGQPRSPNHQRTVSGGSTSSQVSNITTAAPTAARAASKPTMAILKNSGPASPTRQPPPSPSHGGAGSGSGSGSEAFTASVLEDVPQVTVTGPSVVSATFGASIVHITVPEIEEPMMLDDLPPYPTGIGTSDIQSGSPDQADLQVEEADENDGNLAGEATAMGIGEEQEEGEEEEEEEVLSESSDLTDEGVAATLGKGRDLTMEDCESDDGGAHEPQAPVMLKRGDSTVVTEMSDKDIVRHIRMAVWTKGKFLGRGASGSVYITSFPNGFQLALKEIDLSSLSEAALQATLNEYRKHKTLRHRNLVTCYAVAYDTENKQMQVWTEFMRGGTVSALAQRFSMASEYYPQIIRSDVEPHVLVPEDIASNFIRQLVDALAYLHQLNIVHGDVKGSNILLTKDEQTAKLCDFGSAKCVVRPSRNHSPDVATPPPANVDSGSSTAPYNSNPPSTGSSSQQSGQLRTLIGAPILSPSVRRGSVPTGGLGQFDDAGPSESFENHSLSLSEQPIVGTPQWMAPELIADVVEKSQQLSTGRPSSRSSTSGLQGRGAGLRVGSANTRRRKRVAYKLASDIWSVGITAAELLLGGTPPFPPFESNWAAIYQLGTGSVHPCLPLGDLSPSGKDFILQCLKVNPLDRPTAAQLLKHPWLKETSL
jgi:serine/threonine protein kinase